MGEDKRQEHPVWSILSKDRYNADGMKHTEEIYDFMSMVHDKLGDEDTNRLFDYMNKNSDETFWILSSLTEGEYSDEKRV